MIKRIKESFKKNFDTTLWAAIVCTLICTLMLFPTYLCGWHDGFLFREHLKQKATKWFMNTEESR